MTRSPRRPKATALAVAFSVFLGSACAGRCGADRLSDAELEAMTASAAETAARVRGLALPPPAERFAHAIMDREELATYLRRRFEAVDARRTLDAAKRMWVDLGVLDDDVDLLAAYEAAALKQIAGYYDWETKTLYVADWQPRLVQYPVLIHEITHALQDHHFGLARFMTPMEGYDDAQGAAASLIEGDATLTTLEATLEGQPPARKELSYAMVASSAEAQLAQIDAPRVIAESLVFPYTAGLKLARAAYRRGGWPAVNALYKDLPLSTEQVIHPEKHLDAPRDYPRDIRFDVPAPLTAAGWVRVTTTVHGEFGFRTLFKHYLPADAARAAAGGWDGDRVALLERSPGGPSLTLVTSVWDTPADAEEAEAALRRTPSPPIALARVGDRVAGAWGAAVPDAAAIIDALLGELRIDEVRRYQTFIERAANTKAPQSSSTRVKNASSTAK